jgi:hypothetical protein
MVSESLKKAFEFDNAKVNTSSDKFQAADGSLHLT